MLMHSLSLSYNCPSPSSSPHCGFYGTSSTVSCWSCFKSNARHVAPILFPTKLTFLACLHSRPTFSNSSFAPHANQISSVSSAPHLLSFVRALFVFQVLWIKNQKFYPNSGSILFFIKHPVIDLKHTRIFHRSLSRNFCVFVFTFCSI